MSEKQTPETSDESTSSPQDFLVKICPTRAMALASAVLEAAFGSKLSVASATFDRGSSSWKTSQRSLFEVSTLSPEAWPKAGTIRSGSLYALPTLERLTDVSASSWSRGGWPTPMARDFKGPGGSPKMVGSPDLPTMAADPSASAKPSCPADEKQLSLTGEVDSAEQFRSAVLASNLWPTPDASAFNDGQSPEAYEARKVKERAKGYNGNGGGTPLAMAVRLFPTPTAGDAKASGSRVGNPDTKAHPGTSLTDATVRNVKHVSMEEAHQENPDRLLNPDFVEALMGLPPGWTAGPPVQAKRKPSGSPRERSRAKKPVKPPTPDADG